MPKYATITDVIDYEVAPALDEFVDDFDVVEIASETFEYVVNIDDNGVQHGNGYFIQREDVDFWEVVKKYDYGEQLDSAAEKAWDGEGYYDLFYEYGEWVGSEWYDTKVELRHAIAEAMQTCMGMETVYAKKSPTTLRKYFALSPMNRSRRTKADQNRSNGV